MEADRCLSASGTSASLPRQSSRAQPVPEERYGPYGPIGRCPTLVLPKSNRLIGHRNTFVDDALFGSDPHRLPQPQPPNEPADAEKGKAARTCSSQSDSRPLSSPTARSRGSQNGAQGLRDAPTNFRPPGRCAKPPAFTCSMLGGSVAAPADNTSLSVRTRSTPQPRPSGATCARTGLRSGLSAVQRWQTRYRPVKTRPSEVQFGLFAPLSDSQFWSAMEEWYEQDAFAKGKHGMFDTDAVQSVNDTDVIQCLYVKRMPCAKE